jgi:Carboxypeptidase regulatory-like domain
MPQPDLRRVLSLIWFPFFFAAAFALILLASFPAPTPHDIPVQIVGTTSQTHEIRDALDHVRDGGFVVNQAASMSSARADVASNTIAAAYTPGEAHSEVIVASGASGSRANYLTAVFDKVASASGAPAPTRVDVAPLESGDPNGVGLMFIGLPLLLVGLIASIVLAQFGAWPMRSKLITIALVGAFATVFTYFAATAMSVIPNDEWLLLYGFLLTQAIGWITTGAAYFVRQFFLPVAMTFVLILGIPSAGATVNGDMLPGFVRWLNTFMPLAQFVDAARASMYLHNNGLFAPVVVSVAWAMGGAALIGAALLVARQRAQRLRDEEVREDSENENLTESAERIGRLHGTIRTTSGVIVGHARITVIDEHGNEFARAESDGEGEYRLDRLGLGLHHLIVTAPHCEPAIVPVALHASHPAARRDIVLIDWSDPSGNLTFGGIEQARELRDTGGNDGSRGSHALAGL